MLTIAEVAERLKVSDSCVRRLVDAGDIPSIRVGLGRGRIRVTEEDLDLYLNCNRIAGKKKPTQPLEPRRSLEHLKVVDSSR